MTAKTFIDCRSCPKLLKRGMGITNKRDPERILNICKAVHRILRLVDENRLEYIRPAKHYEPHYSIMPDSSCPKVKKLRAAGLVMFADFRINPDGSVLLWSDQISLP